MTIGAALLRIERWLAEHTPVTHDALRPSATLADLDAAEQALGLRLLPDLKRLWMWHNGGDSGPVRAFWLAPDFGLISVSDMLASWRMFNHTYRDELHLDADDNPGWQMSWIPVASSWTGDYLVVDHRDANGMVFPVQRGDGARRDRAWTSLAALTQEVLESLQANQPLRGRLPQVTQEGAWQWGALSRGEVDP